MRTRGQRCAAGFAIAIYAATVGGAVGASPALASPVERRQAGPATTSPGAGASGTPVTTKNLVRGTPTTPAATATPKASTSPSRRVADDNRRVWLVVAGLVLVAVLLALLTAWYWARTRPSRVVQVIGPPRPVGRHGVGRRRSPRGAFGDRSVAQPVVDPHPDPDAVEPTARRRPVRLSRSERDAALQRARNLSR